jgi:hypothetical protein
MKKIIKQILNEVKVKSSDRVKIYDDGKILAVAPLTHTASCKYGSNTPWCVSVPSNDEHYKEYIDYGVLIYFIIKSPYEYGDIKEYKFAYYESFDNDYNDSSGWYDMNDYRYEERGVHDDIKPDLKLVKFLIPKKVMSLVFDYIKLQKPIYEQKFFDKKYRLYNLLINDTNNHIIINNNDYIILTRDTKFGDEYMGDHYFPNINKNSEFLLIYCNKKTYDISYQLIPYRIDIRLYKYTPNTIPPIYTLSTLEVNINITMKNQFIKNFKKIALNFFKQRKINFNQSNEYIYLHPNDVEIGEELYHKMGNIISKETVTNSYKKIVFNTNLYKDIYYDEKLGLNVLYDKEKHNPTKI